MAHPEIISAQENDPAQQALAIFGSMAAQAVNVFAADRVPGQRRVREFGPAGRFKLEVDDDSTVFRVRFGNRGQKERFDIVHYELDKGSEGESRGEIYKTGWTRQEITQDDVSRFSAVESSLRGYLGAYSELARLLNLEIASHG
jgi:hypothetical protein